MSPPCCRSSTGLRARFSVGRICRRRRPRHDQRPEHCRALERTQARIRPRRARAQQCRMRSTVIDDQTPLSRWSCRGFRASSPNSRPSRSKSATDGHRLSPISPRRGAMPSRAVPSSTGLRAKLAQGDKALVGNSGFRRYLKTVSPEHFAVDETRVAEDARFDGLYVLAHQHQAHPLRSCCAIATYCGSSSCSARPRPCLPLAQSTTAATWHSRPRVLLLLACCS